MATSAMSLSTSDLEIETSMFVNLDARYKCVSCRQWLRSPMQTSCGHRICRSCFDKLFSDDSEHARGIPCPANEDDCELITRDETYPDFSAARQMRQLKVFCIYKKYGCTETLAFGKLKEHADRCPFVKNCPHCKERIVTDEVDNHIRDKCPQAPIRCVYCEMSDIPRHQLADHHKVCLMKSRKDCNHIQELLLHEDDVDEQLEMLAMKNARSQAQFQKWYSQKMNATQNDKLAQMEAHIRCLECRLESKCSQLEQLINEFGVTLAQNVNPPGSVRKKFAAADGPVGVHDMRLLSEMDLRLQCAETTNYDGVLVWKICCYRKRKQQAVDGQVLSLYSQPFYTSRYGYKMCARIYLNGDGAGSGTHMSLFFAIMQGNCDELLAWPFSQKVTLTLVDQLNKQQHLSETFQPDPTNSSFQKPTSPMNVASGCPLFVPHSVLEGSKGLYLRNDTIFIKIVVDTTDLLNS